MRIPITRYGLPQAAIYPLVIAALIVGWFLAARWLAGRLNAEGFWPQAAVWLPIALLTVILIWILSFFRDPERTVPSEANLILSPADGKIVKIERLEKAEICDGPALRFEIFLSIFNVHLNRMPCAVEIENIIYKPGRFVDARRPDCSQINESNAIQMRRLNPPLDTLLVRQISGAIARRIVCDLRVGQTCAAGQRFGMIKFGSCTELIVPLRDNLVCVAQVGDDVKAGITILAKYQ